MALDSRPPSYVCHIYHLSAPRNMAEMADIGQCEFWGHHTELRTRYWALGAACREGSSGAGEINDPGNGSKDFRERVAVNCAEAPQEP